MMKIFIYQSPEEVSEYLASTLQEYFCNKADNTINVAISGGSTPKLLFEKMAAREDLMKCWKNIHLYWVDERCVPPEHPESNYRMTKLSLLLPANIPDKQVHRIWGENNPAMEKQRYEQLILENLPMWEGIPRFDLVILGIGNDGHTASIFPGQTDLLKSQNLVETSEHPVNKIERITLTLKLINHAQKVIFHVTGLNKASILKSIISDKDMYLPASHVKPVSGDLSWYLDKDASEKLLIN